LLETAQRQREWWRDAMTSILPWVLVFLAWLLLTKVVLPALGVPT